MSFTRSTGKIAAAATSIYRITAAAVMTYCLLVEVKKYHDAQKQTSRSK